jgi:hypothetical protein
MKLAESYKPVNISEGFLARKDFTQPALAERPGQPFVQRSIN